MYRCDIVSSKIKNGYWIDGVLRVPKISNQKVTTGWRFSSVKYPTVYGYSIKKLISKMTSKQIPCKILTYEEFSSKMRDSIFQYREYGFKRKSGGRPLKLGLDDAKKVIDMLDNEKSFQYIYDEFFEKFKDSPIHQRDSNLTSIITFAVAYEDGLVKMPDEMDVVKQTSLLEESTSKFDEVNEEMSTVTSTMTVDLTKKDSLDTINRNDLEDRISCLESKIDYLYDNCVVENKNEVCEEKSWWKKIIQR